MSDPSMDGLDRLVLGQTREVFGVQGEAPHDTRPGDGIWRIERIEIDADIDAAPDGLLVTLHREIEVALGRDGTRIAATGETAKIALSKDDVRAIAAILLTAP